MDEEKAVNLEHDESPWNLREKKMFALKLSTFSQGNKTALPS